MRIGIDARELCGQPTGVGRYLACLLRAWDRLAEAVPHQFVLYAPAPADGRAASLGEQLGLSVLQVEVRNVPACRHAGPTTTAVPAGTWWEQVHLARAVRHDRPGVLFAPAYTAPLAAGVPIVLTVHDLSFVAHPEWFPAGMRWRQRLLTTLAARRACHVLTDSEFSRGEIVARLGVGATDVSVVPLGLTAPSAVRAPATGAARDPMVLFVGSIFNRRHLPVLIRAVASVSTRHPEVRLEIVGDNRTFPHQDLAALAESAGAAQRTTIRSYVSDDTLAGLYAHAGLFAFLSDYEGFGLTPLEALACGVPILVGDTPVAREVYGDAAAYVQTTDEAGIAGAIERLLSDPASRNALLSKAPRVLGRYSWERAGRQTLAVLLDAPARLRS